MIMEKDLEVAESFEDFLNSSEGILKQLSKGDKADLCWLLLFMAIVLFKSKDGQNKY